MKDETTSKSTDLLGIAPYGEAIKIAVEKGFGAAEAVLSRICLPAAEELGLMFRDKVRYWRLNNIINVINKSEGKLNFDDEKLTLTAHPKVVHEIMENASWTDDDNIQAMWAGLLISSCNEKEGDDSNLLFTNTLKLLTSNQVKTINFLCINCKKKIDRHGFIMAEDMELTDDQLSEILNTKDIVQMDIELDYLRSLEILSNENGFNFGGKKLVANLSPSAFTLNLFVKSQGFKGTPREYFNLEYKETK